MNALFEEAARLSLQEMREDGLYKQERQIASPQGALIAVKGVPGRMLNLCSNNYLGLANSPALIEAARDALSSGGYGVASVRFICGTLDAHLELEQRLAKFLRKEDAVLFSSCFDANGGLFETLFDERDAVISDALNHASIIDGLRLCKARKLIYANNNMDGLEARLNEASGARFRAIITDGVFSMDGVIADLPRICELAERHEAVMIVDDSHATGLLGENGSGTPELFGVADRVDILTGTLGKALGGALGGYVAGSSPVAALLRQRSRPYLFSNALPPVIAAASVRALDIVTHAQDMRAHLAKLAARWRQSLQDAGFILAGEGHPIVPVMIGEAAAAQAMAARLFELGVYVTAFAFPVVPKGKARIRTQMSAAHSFADIDQALEAFVVAGRELDVIPAVNRGEKRA